MSIIGQDQLTHDVPEQQAFASISEFADLLAAAAGLGFYRIRFMTSHPKDISEKLLRVMAANPVIEPHLHLPMQSGSNKILSRMNRQYTREQYLDIVSRPERQAELAFRQTSLSLSRGNRSRLRQNMT